MKRLPQIASIYKRPSRRSCSQEGPSHPLKTSPKTLKCFGSLHPLRVGDKAYGYATALPVLVAMMLLSELESPRQVLWPLFVFEVYVTDSQRIPLRIPACCVFQYHS